MDGVDGDHERAPEDQDVGNAVKQFKPLEKTELAEGVLDDIHEPLFGFIPANLRLHHQQRGKPASQGKGKPCKGYHKQKSGKDWIHILLYYETKGLFL
jgi:hypothetical protein